MPTLPTFLQNKRTLGLILFGLFFVSVMTNVALLRQPDPLSVQNVDRLEERVASQNQTITSLNAEISSYRSQVASLNTEVAQLSEQLERLKSDVQQPGSESVSRPGTSVESSTSLEGTTESGGVAVDAQTNFALVGEGCVFAPSSVTGPQTGKVCDLVDQSTGTVLSTLIDCEEQKYLVYPAGSEGICAQGAELVLGKRDALNLYIINFATVEGAGQNLQPYSYSYRTGRLQQIGNFYAAPRAEGFGESASTQDLGRQFAEAYKQYVADEIPADYFERLYIYE